MSTAQGTPKIKGSKGHAGGTGKKGKKFIEDKSALLSLVDSLPSLNKKRRPTAAEQSEAAPKPVTTSSSNVEAKKKAVERKRAQRLALVEAKKSIVNKEKERKKARKEAKVAEGRAQVGDSSNDGKNRKRVGFVLN